jgi:hypothetical protein
MPRSSSWPQRLYARRTERPSFSNALVARLGTLRSTISPVASLQGAITQFEAAFSFSLDASTQVSADCVISARLMWLLLPRPPLNA